LFAALKESALNYERFEQLRSGAGAYTEPLRTAAYNGIMIPYVKEMREASVDLSQC
jgi:hypothetical protein